MGLRSIFTLMVGLVSANFLWAQQGFQLGTTTTINSTFIIHQNDYGIYNGTPIAPRTTMAYNYTWGYNAGLQLGYNFNDRYTILTSLTYNEGGQHFADTYHPLASDLGYHVERQLDLNYLQLPLFFKYNFGPYGRRVQIYAMTGPEFGILLHASDNIWINNVPQTDVVPGSQRIRNFDAGWGLGAGVDVYIRQDLYFEAGPLGYIGFTDLNSKYLAAKDWVGDHSNKYEPSYNFHPGIDIGFHFLFNKEAHNPFYKKEGEPILPDESE